MIIFLSIWILIYGSVHAYMLWKFHLAFAAWDLWAWLVLAWMIFQNAAPILIHLLDHHMLFWQARTLAWIGYSWMGFLLLFVFYAFWTDVWNLAAHLVRALPALEPRLALGIIVACALATSLYGLWRAAAVPIREVRLRSERLAAGSRPIRLVQISDVHLGLIVRERRLAAITRQIQRARPDILVSTGDMVDASFYRLQGEIDQFNTIEPPLGKFAALGNHEHYSGLGRSVLFLRDCGFQVLRNESAEPSPAVRIVALDDPAGALGAAKLRAEEERLLSNGSEAHRPFTILLKHRPVIDPKSPGRFDLQLSGHVHGGQILPFGLFVRLQYPIATGLHALAEKCHLYISKGTGTWGPPMRVAAPPEVTLFIIEPAEPDAHKASEALENG